MEDFLEIRKRFAYLEYCGLDTTSLTKDDIDKIESKYYLDNFDVLAAELLGLLKEGKDYEETAGLIEYGLGGEDLANYSKILELIGKQSRWHNDRILRFRLFPAVFSKDIKRYIEDELPGILVTYVRGRFRGSSEKILIWKIEDTLHKCNSEEPTWWHSKDFKNIFLHRFSQEYPLCCDGRRPENKSAKQVNRKHASESHVYEYLPDVLPESKREKSPSATLINTKHLAPSRHSKLKQDKSKTVNTAIILFVIASAIVIYMLIF
jgi:hypothetical protein